MNVGLTIPTRGDRDTLGPLVEQCGIPRERIVLVHTDPASTHLDGCVNLTDLAEPNIHRWWNTGIEHATGLGTDVVVVANDDVRVGSPREMSRLAGAADPVSYVGPGRPGRCRLTGWCWAIRTDSRFRPDEAYRWWYGDDQLELDLIAAGTPPTPVDVDIAHLRFDASLDPRLRPLVVADKRRFEERNP